MLEYTQYNNNSAKPHIQEVLDTMEAYKQEFIDFMVESDVLKFGDFTLKSGRKSPFFMNAGAYVTGTQLMRLGEYYAKAIHETYGDDFDVLFGPAYKGIPISVVTAVAYAKLYGKEVRYCSDRKEEKDHGADKGSFLGSKLKDGDRVIMIEDVTTSGKSMEETVPKVRGAADVTIIGLMVSLNRMEVGLGGKVSALDKVWKYKGQAWINMQQDVNELDRKSTGEVDYSTYKGRTTRDYDIQKSNGISFEDISKSKEFIPEYKVLDKNKIGSTYVYRMEKIQ